MLVRRFGLSVPPSVPLPVPVHVRVVVAILVSALVFLAPLPVAVHVRVAVAILVSALVFLVPLPVAVHVRVAVAILVSALVFLVPIPALALDAAALERILAEGTPAEGWAAADSLEQAGVITRATASALRARAANKPGCWKVHGAALDSLFAQGTAAMQAECLSREDSVWYFTLMLDEAYFHARAAADSLAGHAEREEAVLRHVMTAAPLKSQRMRAALELGRIMRYRTPLYAAPEDCTGVARRFIESVAWSPDAGDFRAPARWQLAWLEAEAGDWNRASAVAAELEMSFRGTKWEDRADVVMAMRTRRELSISQVAPGDGRLIVRGASRNLSGPLQVGMGRIDPVWMCRHARLPLSREEVPMAAEDTATTELRHGGDGMWEVSFAAASPGFYRLSVAAPDTAIISTLGVLNVALVTDDTSPECVTNESPEIVTVHRGGRDFGSPEQTSASRVLLPGATWCGEGEAPVQFVVCDTTHAGWCGPTLAGPAWVVWTPVRHVGEGGP